MESDPYPFESASDKDLIEFILLLLKKDPDARPSAE